LKMLKSLTNVKTQFELDDEKHLSNSGAYQWNRKILGLIFFVILHSLNYITEAKDAAGNPVPFPNPSRENTIAETPRLKCLIDKSELQYDLKLRRWFFWF
jgi:hypothetical protein